MQQMRAQLKSVWSALLDMPAESIDDASHFLEAGGNSLLLLSLQVEIARTFGIELAYGELLSAMTFAAMCARVATASGTSVFQ